MKKLILTAILATASTTVVPASNGLNVQAWPGAQPLPQVQTSVAGASHKSAAFMQMPLTPGFVSGNDVAAPEGMQKAPAITESMVRPAGSRATAWSEWYDFSSGTLGVGPIITELFGVPETSRVTLQRRDDSNNPDNVQFRFKGLFGDYDVVMNWNSRSCEYNMEAYTFEGLANPYSSVVPKLMPRKGMFFPRGKFSTSLFFVVHENDYGYYAQLVYNPDNGADAYIVGADDTDFNPNATLQTATITATGADVAKIKYATVYSESPSIRIGDRSIYLPSAIAAGEKGIERKSVSTAELPKTLTAHVDKSGVWYMSILMYDSADQPIGFAGRYFYVSLQEPEKWKSLGMASFTDNYMADIFGQYRMAEPDGTLPSWSANLTWEVELQQSKENEGLYRLVNPYTCATSPCSDFVLTYGISNEEKFYFEVNFDKKHDYYLIFDVSNPAAAWSYLTLAGFRYNNSLCVFTGQQGVVSSNQGLEPSEYYPGNISYDPEGCIISTIEPKMTVKFPGFVDYTFKLDFDGMKTVSLASMGDAAASVRYTVQGDIEDADNDEYNAIFKALVDNNTSAITIATATTAGKLDLSAFDVKDETVYTVYAVSVDAQGQVQKRATMDFYLQKHEYKYLGIGQFSDPLFGADFYNVEVYTADDAPGHYFVVNPFYGNPQFSINYRFPSYLDLDCTDTAKVQVPMYGTGVVYTDYGEAYIVSYGILREHFGKQPLDTDYGKLDDGEILMPAESLVMQFEPYGSNGYTISHDLCLRLPGYVSYDYDIDFRNSTFTLYGMAPAVDAIEYTLVDKGSMADDELLAAIMNGTVQTASVKEPGVMALDMFNPEVFKSYTLAMVSVADDGYGNKVYHKFKSYTFFNDMQVYYLGKGKYNDALVYMFTELFGLEFDLSDFLAEREVELYTSSVLPGTILVKDPLQMMREANDCSYAASYYLPIVIENPDRVYIKDGVFGSIDKLPSQYSDLRFSTAAGYLMGQGKKPDEIPAEYYGTLRGTVVEIPANVIVWGGYFVTGEGKTPPYQSLRLVLPDDYAGVEGVEADTADGPAEYFDLSGRRVEHPTAGIYIVRRGTKVGKVMVR